MKEASVSFIPFLTLVIVKSVGLRVVDNVSVLEIKVEKYKITLNLIVLK